MGRFSQQAGLTLPAIRGRQGGRTMYMVMASNPVVNNLFTPDMEPTAERSQRAFDPNHAKAIAQYMIKNKDEYVLGTLTYAVDQEGVFEPVEEGAAIGLLHLPMDANLRSVDGQHRRHGIKNAMDLAEWVKNEDLGILIYVEPLVERRKQMFSDMNWTVRPVSKSVNVGFNSRDPFSVATNRLVETHPLLAGQIELERAWITKASGKLFTLGAIYDALVRLIVGPDRRAKTKPEYTVDSIFVQGEEFFQLLLDARDEFQRALDDPNIGDELRKTTILLNGTTLKVLAGAAHLAIKGGLTLDGLKEPIGMIDFHPSAAIWQDSGFVAPDKTTPASRNQEIRAATIAVLRLFQKPAALPTEIIPN